MPEPRLLKYWFQTHPDGFGLAFQNKDKVTILKGGMYQRQMFGIIRTMRKLTADRDIKDFTVILHFRQATDGSVEPKNCHPFPVTNNIKHLGGLNVDTDCALAHNGIIFDYAHYVGRNYVYNHSGKTDTQQFIEDFLAYMGDALFVPAVQDLIEVYTSSKFALLTPATHYLIGDFIEEKGYLYSNGGFRVEPPVVVHYAGQAQPWRYNMGEYGLSNYETCDLCQSWDEEMYQAPTGDHVCFTCYQKLYGVAPNYSQMVRERKLITEGTELYEY